MFTFLITFGGRKSLNFTFQVDPNKPIIVPGDRAKEHAKKVDKEEGIHYLQDQLDTCARLAKQLGVKPLTFLQQ